MSPTRASATKTIRIGRAAMTAAALGLMLILAGCGSSSGGSSSGTSSATSSPATTPATTASETTSSAAATTTSTSAAGTTLSLSANPEGQLKYNTTSLTAPAGKISIDFTNMSPVGHNVTIESSSRQTLGATPTFMGGSKTLTLDLKAGTYKYFCSVPGHRQAGMEGTLTVS
jgi:plastocyanin